MPELGRVAAANSVDIALVTYGSVAYTAAQTARRAWVASPGVEDPWIGLGPNRHEALRLAQLARQGELVVFIGAGVSASAGLPAWQALLDQIARRAGVPDADLAHLHRMDVRDQAAFLQTQFHSPDNWTWAVSEVFAASRFSLHHGLLGSLPVRETVTTNFDTLFERATAKWGHQVSVLPGGNVDPHRRLLAKLHGTLGGQFALTREEYRNIRSGFGAIYGLVQALLLTRHMLFVGYSLRDDDFHDLVHDVRAVRSPSRGGKLGTALMVSGNPVLARLWSDMTFVFARDPQPAVEGRVDDLGEDELSDAARWQAIFLDYVGYESASRVAFVADP